MEKKIEKSFTKSKQIKMFMSGRSLTFAMKDVDIIMT